MPNGHSLKKKIQNYWERQYHDGSHHHENTYTCQKGDPKYFRTRFDRGKWKLLWTRQKSYKQIVQSSKEKKKKKNSHNYKQEKSSLINDKT